MRQRERFLIMLALYMVGWLLDGEWLDTSEIFFMLIAFSVGYFASAWENWEGS